MPHPTDNRDANAFASPQRTPEIPTVLRFQLLLASLLLNAGVAAAQGTAPDTTTAPDDGAVPIPLTRVVELAEHNATQVIQAQGQTRTRNAAVRSAYAAFIPSLTVSAGGTRQLPSGARTRIENGQVITLPPQPWSYAMGLNASVDLFDGGRRIFDLQQARASAGAARVHETTARYAAVLDAKQQFFNVLAARESESAARTQLEQAELDLRSSTARVLARTVTRSDSLRAEIQVRNARIAVTEARTSRMIANAALSQLIGSTQLVTAAETDTLGPPELPLDEPALRTLVEHGPAVAEAQANLDAARASRRGSWSGYLPTLTTSYSRNGNAVGDALFPSGDPFTYSGALRLSVSLPLFNQLQREEQRTDLDVAADNAAAELRDAQLAARLNLATALGAWRSARERVDLQTASVLAGIEDLRVQQQRYAVGGSTLLDVLTSQTQLDQARRDLIRARYDQRVARAQLEALAGRSL